MRLINADEMVKSLMDMTFYDEEGYTIDDYEDRLAIVKSFVDSVQTVDAIPVEFIRKQMERYDKEAHKYSEENKSMLAIYEIDKYNALKHILDDWQKESGEWEEYIKGTL